MPKPDDGDDDLIEVVRRGLRRSTPQQRTVLMELVVAEMLDGQDYASLMLWQGLISEAVNEYLRMLNRTNRAVCGCCWDNLSDDLKRRLEGKIDVERAVR
jgi:hypothetical protein